MNSNGSNLAYRAYEIGRNEGISELISASVRFCRQRIHRGKIKSELNLQCNGVSVTFDTSNPVSERWFYPRYLEGDLHEPAFTRRLIDVLDSDSVFYDVGANVGYFTLFASEVCVDGEVHSFEMDKKFIKSINSSLERNGTVAHLVNKAISDTSNTLKYTDGLVPNVSDTDEGKQVESITLDKYAGEHSPPDVMKIDVEGFEYEVLHGSLEVFQAKKPKKLFIEVHPDKLESYGHSVTDILSLLDNHGFNYTKFSNHRGDTMETPELDTSDDISGNTMLECTI
jgi:FkbM family methyltransferase